VKESTDMANESVSIDWLFAMSAKNIWIIMNEKKEKNAKFKTYSLLGGEFLFSPFSSGVVVDTISFVLPLLS
jgi:hypothetical protein